VFSGICVWMWKDFVFKCILLQSVTNQMSVIDHALFLRKSSTYSPFYYDLLFGVYQDLTLSCMPGLVSKLRRCYSELSSIWSPFKQIMTLNWWASGSAPASNPGVTSVANKWKAYVYSCCIIGRACICGKLLFFVSRRYKRGLQVCIGKRKGHPRKLHGVRNFFL